jgi:hypothetical protein
MGKTSQFVKAVDAFVAVPKTLVLGNTPIVWQRARDDDALRLQLPLEVNGEQFGEQLTIDAFPDRRPRMFNLGLMFGVHMVDRLDFDPSSTHGNNWNSALPIVVAGPHWHSWELNRGTVRNVNKFIPLPYADTFSEAKEFDAVLRWYCQARNIQIGAHGIDFPAPGRLI